MGVSSSRIISPSHSSSSRSGGHDRRSRISSAPLPRSCSPLNVNTSNSGRDTMNHLSTEPTSAATLESTGTTNVGANTFTTSNTSSVTTSPNSNSSRFRSNSRVFLSPLRRRIRNSSIFRLSTFSRPPMEQTLSRFRQLRSRRRSSPPTDGYSSDIHRCHNSSSSSSSSSSTSPLPTSSRSPCSSHLSSSSPPFSPTQTDHHNSTSPSPPTSSRIRSFTHSLRRQASSSLRSPDDQIAILSRLLSVAAAATAATLLGTSDLSSSTSATSPSDSLYPYSHDDTNFPSFLEALRNGQISAALRGSMSGDSESESPSFMDDTRLNFFRMFRFSAVDNTSSQTTLNSELRLVPVIIVGIRSISSSAPEDDQNLLPFLDFLSNLPTSSDDAFTSFRRHPQDLRERAASASDGVGVEPTYSTTNAAPTTTTPSDGATGANSSNDSLSSPSPFSPDRSSSLDLPHNSIPDDSSPRPASMPYLTPDPSLTSTSSTPSLSYDDLDSSPIDASILDLSSSLPTPPLTRAPSLRERRNSQGAFTRYGLGSPRRNGYIAPENSEGAQSWIIYVFGGSYPENHPILSTPSLFSDNPSYEDLLVLPALLGPAKPPVASVSDVEAAPGVFIIRKSTEERFLACGLDSSEQITLDKTQKCLVCLCEYEMNDVCRRLVNCDHMYHKDCIDQWLTTGRNSCPLCRAQGVLEKLPDESVTTATAAAPA